MPPNEVSHSSEPSPAPEPESIGATLPIAEQTGEIAGAQPQPTKAAKLANLGVASDPAREALFDEIERQLRLKRGGGNQEPGE